MKTGSRAPGPGRCVCLALDLSNREEILGAAARFGPRVEWLKIGLEAFVSEGPGLVAEVARHARVFLDSEADHHCRREAIGA